VLPETNFAARAKEVCASFAGGRDSTNHINPAVAAVSPRRTRRRPEGTAERFNKLFAGVDEEWRSLLTNSPAPKSCQTRAAKPCARFLRLRHAIMASTAAIAALHGHSCTAKTARLKRKVDETDARTPALRRGDGAA